MLLSTSFFSCYFSFKLRHPPQKNFDWLLFPRPFLRLTLRSNLIDTDSPCKTFSKPWPTYRSAFVLNSQLINYTRLIKIRLELELSKRGMNLVFFVQSIKWLMSVFLWRQGTHISFDFHLFHSFFSPRLPVTFTGN